MNNQEREKVVITYKGQKRTYYSDDNFFTVVNDFKNQFKYEIVLVLFDGSIKELWKTIKKSGEIDFITLDSTIGIETYRRSLTFMTVKAIFDAMGHDKVRNVRLLYSLKSGYYFTVDGSLSIDEDFIRKVKSRMNSMVEQEMDIRKSALKTKDATKLCKEFGMYDKEKLFSYRNNSLVNMYTMNNFIDYYYGVMIPHAGYLKWFDLVLYDEGFVLLFPDKKTPHTVPKLEVEEKLFETRKEATKWADTLGIRTVGDLNDAIVNGRFNDLILVQEAIQEKQIGDIAKQIAENPDIKFVLIAGPSSSSKTSFSHRLSIQLQTQGIKPHPIATDNYFVNRVDNPKDEDGNYNFECLEAMDIELLNTQLEQLLNGEEVSLPTYNFVDGVKEYKGNTLKLEEHDILVIEGIHCLNDKLTYKLNKKNKFKIYISALAQLGIDEHNRFPSTDGRLIRRMVRDARTRGVSAADTIKMWPSVRRGEENYIFPYQETADVMFNTALIYELAVLKQYCIPLLYSVPSDAPEFLEAKRLIKMFDYFVGFNADNVPNNSLLKEFIGGSIFPVG